MNVDKRCVTKLLFVSLCKSNTQIPTAGGGYRGVVVLRSAKVPEAGNSAGIEIVMNKFYFILVINLLFNISVNGQNIDLIRIDSIYSEYGVIFPGSYKLSIELSGLTTRFTPTIEEVKATEQIFIDQFRNLDHNKSNFPNGYRIADTKNYFNKFIRQYIGYEDERGNRNILIHLINNESPRKVKKVIANNWKENFIVIFADPMPFDILTYRVNLLEKKLNIDF